MSHGTPPWVSLRGRPSSCAIEQAERRRQAGCSRNCTSSRNATTVCFRCLRRRVRTRISDERRDSQRHRRWEIDVCGAIGSGRRRCIPDLGQRRAIPNSCADAPDARSGEFVALGAGVTGGTSPWFGFNVLLFANMLCEAATMTIQIKGETIPAEEPGSLATGDRQPVGVFVGLAGWNAPTSLE